MTKGNIAFNPLAIEKGEKARSFYVKNGKKIQASVHLANEMEHAVEMFPKIFMRSSRTEDRSENGKKKKIVKRKVECGISRAAQVPRCRQFFFFLFPPLIIECLVSQWDWEWPREKESRESLVSRGAVYTKETLDRIIKGTK